MKKPILTIFFIIINVLVYLFTLIVGTDNMFSLFGMYQGAVENNEGFRIITSTIIHSGIIHLLSNMVCLYYFGRELECNISRIKYILIVIISMLGAGYIINRFGGIDVIHGGASGVVFGLFAAVFILEYNIGKDYSNTLYALILNLILSFSYGISWQAHIGGLVGGLIAGYLFCRQRYSKNVSYREWKRLHPNCSDDYYNEYINNRS